MKLTFNRIISHFSVIGNMMDIASRRRYYWIFLTVVTAISIVTGIAVRLFLSQPLLDIIGITNVEIKVGSRPSGWYHLYIPLEDRIMDAAFFDVQLHVSVQNSKYNDSSNLNLVVKFMFYNFTVASETKIIDILRSRETRTILIHFYSLPDVYLFNRLNYDKGPFFTATLYSSNEVLDEKIVDYLGS
jgi:hypothetical protein